MTVQATFCATLVDEWARAGLSDAVVCPGSRSAPLALALAADERVRVHVRLDERSAGFVALGLALASGRPSVVLTTSGTAAVNLHPAVVEAHQAGVALLVCTADRPPELHLVGAPQTVEQSRLFGSAVHWAFDPGVADEAGSGFWRSIAARAWLEAVEGRGPVHLDLAFREPLVGEPGALPEGRPLGAPWHVARRAPAPTARTGSARVSGRGVVVAGRGVDDPEAVHELARAAGWPVLADPRSGCRVPRQHTVAAADALLRSWRPTSAPEVVVRVGEPWASKVVNQWLATCGAVQVLVDPHRRWRDPERVAAFVTDLLPDPVEPAARSWLDEWRAAETAAQDAIDAVLAGHTEANEPALARGLCAALPNNSVLVVSSSMPVRDVEWYMRPRKGLTVLANRGANGIDGVLSTAIGVALADPATPVTVLLGDLALLHDVGALQHGLPSNLDVVVVDNGGGGIFSFLPQASVVAGDRFETLFATPHGLDLAKLAEAFGAPVRVVTTDRSANVALHDEIHAAVARAVGSRPT